MLMSYPGMEVINMIDVRFAKGGKGKSSKGGGAKGGGGSGGGWFGAGQ